MIIYKMKLTAVTSETLYESINIYITDNKNKVKTYDDMIDVVLKMMKSGYYFPFDRDILRDAMESLTFMYCPGDEMNRDRVVCQLEDMDDDDDDDDESDGGEDGVRSALAGLGGLGGLGGQGGDPMEMMSKLFSGMVDPSSVQKATKKEECSDCPSKGCADCPKKEEEAKDAKEDAKEDEVVSEETVAVDDIVVEDVEDADDVDDVDDVGESTEEKTEK